MNYCTMGLRAFFWSLVVMLVFAWLAPLPLARAQAFTQPRPFALKLGSSIETYSAQPHAVRRPSFGISDEVIGRVNLHLGEIAAAEQSQRLLTAVQFLALGTYWGAVGVTLLVYNHRFTDISRGQAYLVGGVTTGLGTLSALYGTYTLLRPWAAERLAMEYRDAVAAGEYSRATALLNARLSDLGAAERRQRWINGIIAGLSTLYSAALFVGGEIKAKNENERLQVRTLAGMGLVAGLSMITTALLIKSPIERLIDVLRREPQMWLLEPVATPTEAGLQLGVRF